MTAFEKTILRVVERSATETRVHIKYLPEVLALVAKGKLKLLKSGPDILIVERAT